MPFGAVGGRVLRRPDLPDEGARRRRKVSGDVRGRVLLGLPARLRVPLELRRRRRFAPARAVGAGSLVRGRREALQSFGLRPLTFAGGRLCRVTIPGSRAGGLFFRGRRLVRFGGQMPAVSFGLFRRGRRPTIQVGAGHGGERAAPAAQHEN